MNLHFRCPVSNTLCTSPEYSLESGYVVTACENGERELQGKVLLPVCPACGGKHRFDVTEVMCSLNATRKEEQDGNND